MADLAPGSYLVAFTAEADYRAANHRLYVVCELRIDGAVVTHTKGIVGESAGSTGSLNLAIVFPVNRDDRFGMSVTCYPDQNSVAGQPSPSIQTPKLAAIQLDSVRTN